MTLFEGLATNQIEALIEGAEEKALKHREILYCAGDQASSFAILIEGALKLVKPTSVGDDIIVHFATPGDLVAALIMPQKNSVYPVSVVALGPSTVFKIPRRTFVAVWAADQIIMQRINEVLFRRMSEMQEQKAMTKAFLAPKIARQLISLIERLGGEGETILPIPLTRQEIADSLGASVESVIRVMSDWSRNGLIRTTEQHIEIVRMDKIVEILRN